MEWRRQRRKSLHEELLEQGAREAAPEPEAPNGQQQLSKSALAVLLVVLIGSVLVHFGPLWLQGVLAVVMFVYFTLTARSRPRPAKPRQFGLIRGLFLIWLAISVSVTVLVGLDDFFRGENVLILAVVWLILAALWLLDRLLPRLWAALTSGSLT